MLADVVYTKEYPVEAAFERVGWISAQDATEERPFVIVDTVVATIGNNGAKYGYQDRDGEKLYNSQTSEGFFAIAGLSAYISIESGIDQQALYYQPEAERGFGLSILTIGTNGFHSPNEEDKLWADSRQDFIAKLKESMAGRGVSEHYSAFYYALNSMMGHERLNSRDWLRNYKPEDLFMPDPTMAETTREQASYAADIQQTLEAAQAEDELMKGRLTVFSDVPAADIPEIFRESRLRVSELEFKALKLRNSLLAAGAVYSPIDNRVDGRSWPYMDPLDKDETRSFGKELRALESKDARDADHELSRELNELANRIAYAAHGKMVLQKLNQVELSL